MNAANEGSYYKSYLYAHTRTRTHTHTHAHTHFCQNKILDNFENLSPGEESSLDIQVQGGVEGKRCGGLQSHFQSGREAPNQAFYKVL